MRGGDPLPDLQLWRKDGVFPACAGVIPLMSTKKTKSGSIPRMRGGDPIGEGSFKLDYQYSPHARG